MKTCPHCGKSLAKTVVDSKYKQDVQKARLAIACLDRVLSQSLDEWIRNGLAQTSTSFGTFRVAVEAERDRLLAVIDNPAKLYAIYRRGDKRTPVNYGMEALKLAA